MSRFHLYVQLPKIKDVGVGTLDVDRQGAARFYTDTLAREMLRVRIDFAGADGIQISGMEEIGREKDGGIKYCYQEWWLRYCEP